MRVARECPRIAAFAIRKFLIRARVERAILPGSRV